MFFTLEADREMIENNVDEYGDSFCRDLTIRTLQRLCETMPEPEDKPRSFNFFNQLDEHGVDVDDMPGTMFRRTVVYFDKADSADLNMEYAQHVVRMANGTLVNDLDNELLTHIVVSEDRSRLSDLRKTISRRTRVPRFVTLAWVMESSKEKTLLDEERFAPV